MQTPTPRVALALVLLLAASPAFAQTPITRGPLPVGTRLAWEASSNITTVAQALTFEARLYRGGLPLTALTGVTCAPAVAPLVGITCQSVLGQSNLDGINQVGISALTLSLFRADVGEGPVSSPFTLTTGAGAPTGARLIP